MSKRTLLPLVTLALFALLGSPSAFAEAPSVVAPAAVAPVAELPSAAVPSSDCGAPAAIVAPALPSLGGAPAWQLAAKPSVVETAAGCSAYAVCENGQTISCSTNTGSSVSCQGRDQNCAANTIGYVFCEGNDDFVTCPPCEPGCDPNARCIWGASCDPGCCGTGSCVNGSCNCDA